MRLDDFNVSSIKTANNIGRILITIVNWRQSSPSSNYVITELRSLDAPKHIPRKSEYITSVSKQPLTFYRIIWIITAGKSGQKSETKR